MNTRNFFKTLALGAAGIAVAPSIFIQKEDDPLYWVNQRGFWNPKDYWYCWREWRTTPGWKPRPGYVDSCGVSVEVPESRFRDIPWAKLNPDGTLNGLYVWAKWTPGAKMAIV